MLNYGWQYELTLWEQIPVDLRDSQSWRSVSFTELDAVSVPKEAGIYLFCTSPVGRKFPDFLLKSDLFSNLLSPIYIGKTNNLHQRFRQHCRNPSEPLKAARLCFSSSMLFWFHCCRRERLDTVEPVLISCFGPTANRRAEPIKATVGEPIPIGIQS